MRRILVLLAVLSLAARWGDAACGCAAHHGWVKTSECRHAHDHEVPVDQDRPAGPIVDHGCEGDCDAAVYPPATRVVLPAMTANLAAERFDPFRAVAFLRGCDAAATGGPPSRSMLGVYRI